MKLACRDLTAEDALCAASVATLQIVRKIAKARNGDHGGVSVRGQRQRLGDGIHGLMGEIALARELNLPWTPGGMRVSRGDVASLIEVRATEYASGHLLIYTEDEDHSVFVLMIGGYPTFSIGGWIFGGECKQQCWWRATADPPCWWVPQSELRDMSELHINGAAP